VQGETKKYGRMHEAWCVGLIAGDNYVTVGSQRVAQGEIDNFDVCVRVIVGDAILGVLNKGVIASVALVPNGAAEARGAGCARRVRAGSCCCARGGAGAKRLVVSRLLSSIRLRSSIAGSVAAANCSLD
jgi:hypothetical protein